MDFEWDSELKAFREEVIEFCRQYASPELQKEMRGSDGEGGRGGPLTRELQRELERRNWMRLAWPIQYGGAGKSTWYQFIMVQAFSYYGIPFGGLSVGSIAPALMNFGTDEQKKKYLPGILDGEITFAIGYSEPNAGTDLASLQTRAVKDGDDWIINGQKIWTSQAQVATHLWLAARTDPDAPKHRGISMLIVPLNLQGISIRPLYTMSGVRTNEVFFENVRVPVDALIGEQNRGWYTVTNALDHERVSLGPIGQLARQFDQMMDYLKDHRLGQLRSEATRRSLAEMKLDLHVLRALNLVNAAIIANHDTPTMEASMVKVWSSELRYRLSSLNMDLLGRYGGLTAEAEELAPMQGMNEQTYRSSPILRFGGGTNEVQRNIIAQRGLGLPR